MDCGWINRTYCYFWIDSLAVLSVFILKCVSRSFFFFFYFFLNMFYPFIHLLLKVGFTRFPTFFYVYIKNSTTGLLWECSPQNTKMIINIGVYIQKYTPTNILIGLRATFSVWEKNVDFKGSDIIISLIIGCISR